MKLQNKKTGQEGNFIINKDHFECVDLDLVPEYNSLAELNEEWEDYEEPLKPYWFINDLDGEPMKCDLKNCGKSNFTKWGEYRKQIGNYFETKEEAEKAVDKLKAWKRLKDNGFKFNGWEDSPAEDDFDMIWFTMKAKVWDVETQEALDLLFGGEE